MEFQTCLEKEHFSTTLNTHQYSFACNNSRNMDTFQGIADSDVYKWDIDNEKKLNDDLDLLPELSDNSDESMSKMMDFSPAIEFPKLTDMLDLIDIDTDNILPIDEALISPLQNELDVSSLDISAYLMSEQPEPIAKFEQISIPERKVRAGVKKIDMHARKYIVDPATDDDYNEYINVEETSTEDTDSVPLLEANDVLSLFEQFEATEIMQLSENLLASAVIEQLDSEVAKSDGLKNEEINDKTDPDIYFKKDIETETNTTETVVNTPVAQETSVPHHHLVIPEEQTLVQAFTQEINNIQQFPPEKIFSETTNHMPKLGQNSITSVTEEPTQVQNSTITVVEEPTQVQMGMVLNELLQEISPQQTTNHSPNLVQNLNHSVTEEPTKVQNSTISVVEEPTRVQNAMVLNELPQKISPQQTTNHTPNMPNSNNSVMEEPTPVQSRKVLNELPQDIISRINSRKRKTIRVIPPIIPNKKRGGPKAANAEQLAPSKVVKSDKSDKLSNIYLDHNYCLKTNLEPIVKKEQNSSSTEEDQRSIIMKQPVVKTSDGKLMVSLLKANTIHDNISREKRKLNIEEYKKRKEGKLKLQSTQNKSASSCSSPVQTDENTLLLKHQKKLERMAMEVLSSRPKKGKTDETPLIIVPYKAPELPPDIEQKTVISIGVNTDFKICKNLDPVTPVQQLEEIKPLLASARHKINSNSLITSLIENIPKVINNTTNSETNKGNVSHEHGENKIISYLPKNRLPVETSTVEVQTNISLIQQTKDARYRRRKSPSSSSTNSRSSVHYSRSRTASHSSSSSSHSSRNSYYKSSSRSRSPSRSPRSPPPSKYTKWENERFREVEERRVVYVGRIAARTSQEYLRQRFERFGPITNISVHFRDHGYLDNYGFVTFANQYDAFRAIEHANDDPYYPKYDLSFGGRRQFCITSYSDLDNMRDDTTYYPVPTAQNSFDSLLRDAQEKIRRRKF